MDATSLWWDRIKRIIETYEVCLLVGKFSGSTEQVVPQLTARGLKIYICSLYHWLHRAKDAEGYCFGIEPCQIFYIGGAALCEMQWDINCIGDILEVAARSSAGPQSPARWSCCESERNNTQYGDFLEDWRGKPTQLEMNLNGPLAKWIAWRCDRAPCFFLHI